MSICPRCGSILDGPRENPKTGRLGRKCPDCLDWQLLPIAGPAAAVRRAMASGRGQFRGGGTGRPAI